MSGICHLVEHIDTTTAVSFKGNSCSFSGGSTISKRGRQPLRGVPTYYLTNFSRKLQENEDILDRGRGGTRPSCPLDPPLPFLRAFKHSVFHFCNITLQN